MFLFKNTYDMDFHFYFNYINPFTIYVKFKTGARAPVYLSYSSISSSASS